MVQAITELKARGLRVVLYPFVVMDIPTGNSLPNPYSNNAATVGQPAFPWRGRITCAPAPGYAGTVDKTAAATPSQIDAFFGTAMPAHFEAWNGNTIPYKRSERMVVSALHPALRQGCRRGGRRRWLPDRLEMVALNRVRSGASTFPAVSHGLRSPRT